MRDWSHDKQDDEQILARSSGPRRPDGGRTRGRACLAVGSDRVDLGEDRLHAETLRGGSSRLRPTGQEPGVPTDDSERLKALERENRELRQANEILRKASAYFAQAELDRRFKP